MTAGPYSIGSTHWPGLAKVAEEAGETIQAIGKLIAANGDGRHWDGTDLQQRLEDELADLQAAISFCITASNLDIRAIHTRTQHKTGLFTRWHREHSDGTTLPSGQQVTA